MVEREYVNDYVIQATMELEDWNEKLADGWDRVGNYFFRKRWDYFEGFTSNLEYVKVTLQLMPLRYNLNANFTFKKGQRAIQRKNEDLHRVYRPAHLTEEKYQLFDLWHKSRFGSSSFIEQWVTNDSTPFPTMEVCLYKHDRLIACSFFDETPQFDYSTLAIFDPNESKRSLGTYTLISEVEYGLMQGKKAHYPGHAHYERSMYEYKKKFNNVECYDWETKDWKML